MLFRSAPRARGVGEVGRIAPLQVQAEPAVERAAVNSGPPRGFADRDALGDEEDGLEAAEEASFSRLCEGLRQPPAVMPGEIGSSSSVITAHRRRFWFKDQSVAKLVATYLALHISRRRCDGIGSPNLQVATSLSNL